MKLTEAQVRFTLGTLLVPAAVLAAYYSVILGLVNHWWNDENYSHGLIVPFVVGLIIWQDIGRLRTIARKPEFSLGLIIVITGLMMLLLGTLGSELLTQRVSLIVVLAGSVVYFLGRRVLFSLAVPFGLLLLAIPIPQIIFNKVAFPLQLLATRAAHTSLLFLGIPSERSGNVINLITINGNSAALEVVEACSGIRSLITLMTLAIIIAYFTRDEHVNDHRRFRDFFSDPNLRRTIFLMLLMVPVALVTNALRVVLTGIATYFSGREILDSWWHDAIGWASFGLALVLLITANWAISKVRFLNRINTESFSRDGPRKSAIHKSARGWQVAPLLFTLLTAGFVINWLHHRSPVKVERRSFSEFPFRISNAVRIGEDAKFDLETERVLGATDYIMRNYIEPPRKFNLYIGFYAAQRTGATYHSPLNCLPGTGWSMSDGTQVEIQTGNGAIFSANQYIVQQGSNRQVMIYWYQGRGRTNTSEYSDKLYTVIDSMRTGRTDGSMVRVLTPAYYDETDLVAQESAQKFAASVYDVIQPFVPD